MNKRGLGTMAVMHADDSGGDHAETLEEKKQRIRRELIKAGMSSYGLAKFNTRYLPSLIKDGEHIHGVVYGRYVERAGLLSWVDHMMVATDHRVISFNHKPGYTEDDVFTYDVVNGVDYSAAGPFRAVTLDTRTGRVTVRFVNKKCSDIFIKYVARKRVEFFRTRTQRELPSPKSRP